MGQVKIGVLPDNALLEIFDFYRADPTSEIFGRLSWKWKTLTQVCRRWRYLIFESPRRLDLRIVCTATTPSRTLLDIWPPFPISIFGTSSCVVDEKGIENITTALGHRGRTSGIYLIDVKGSLLQKMAPMMNELHPILTDIYLLSTDESVPVLPETFLGGSAPRLRSFILSGIPFPTLHNFILSATQIIHLSLFDIPLSGYISPEVMVTCLAALPNLEYLAIGFRFRSPISRQIGLPPLTPAVLPSLTKLFFRGASEYLEELLTRTHTPQLNRLNILFFKDLIFDLPRLRSLVIRGEGLRPHSLAWIIFDVHKINITLGSPPRIVLAILFEEWDRQLTSLAQVCNQNLPVLSFVEQLSICEPRRASLSWRGDMSSLQWLQLFLPFIAVRDLYVSEQLVPFATAALKELTGERSMEVLPALNRLFLERFQPSGFVQEAIEPFVSSRQLSGHPVAVHSEQPPPELANHPHPPRN